MLKFEVDPDQIEDCNMMFPKVTFILSDEAMLPEVVSAFESFLKAAGYSFDGHLDLVKDYNEDDKGIPYGSDLCKGQTWPEEDDGAIE